VSGTQSTTSTAIVQVLSETTQSQKIDTHASTVERKHGRDCRKRCGAPSLLTLVVQKRPRHHALQITSPRQVTATFQRLASRNRIASMRGILPSGVGAVQADYAHRAPLSHTSSSGTAARVCCGRDATESTDRTGWSQKRPFRSWRIRIDPGYVHAPRALSGAHYYRPDFEAHGIPRLARSRGGLVESWSALLACARLARAPGWSDPAFAARPPVDGAMAELFQ